MAEVEIKYDYRDDDLYHKQQTHKPRVFGAPIVFADDAYNAIWAMYRPPKGVSMDDQLKSFYKTPMEDPKAERADGIFKGGIPTTVLMPLAEFWVQHPLLKPLRKEYENCKVLKVNPNLCLTEGIKYARKMNQVAEQPFTKCPKQTVGWSKCLEDNAQQYQVCRDLQVEWEACMKSHFDMKFPPFPLHPRRHEWNADSTDPYRMRFKLRGRDNLSDLTRHAGYGAVHPETDLFADNY